MKEWERNEMMNEYEKACKEFLNGCTCVGPDHQEECPECLTAFCNQLRKLGREEKYEGMNKHCINGGMGGK
jgi:hypothetical protein